MRIQNRQTQVKQAECCIDYCTTNYSVSGVEIVNSYKCNQRQFSTSDIWNIQKQKREIAVGSNFL